MVAIDRILQGGFALGSLIYLDNNMDNFPDCDEPGVPGIRTDFFDCQGNPILQPVWTNVDGEFEFPSVPATQQFTWRVSLPEAYEFVGLFDSFKGENDPPQSGVVVGSGESAVGLRTVERTSCLDTQGQDYTSELAVKLTGVDGPFPADCSVIDSGPPSPVQFPTFGPSMPPANAPTATIAPSTAPIPNPVVSTNAPTNGPTNAPTNPPVAQGPSLDELETFFATTAGTDPALFDDPSSPQAQAAQWVADNTALTISGSPDQLCEEFALASFYYATAGDSWTDNTDWLSATADSCDWFNVTCDGSGLVTGLTFEDNNLDGELPSELRCLSSLQTLSFFTNNLQGELPNFLPPTVETLDFEFNSFSGSIPTEFSTLVNLQTLNLAQNFLTGDLEFGIGSLTQLMDLSLIVNQFSATLPTELFSIGTLEVIRLDDNLWFDTIPTEVGQLTNLAEFSVLNNTFSGEIPSEFGSIQTLDTLILGVNFLSGTVPAELGNLPALRILDMMTNDLTGNIPDNLGNLGDTLELFDVSFTTLSGALPNGLCGVTDLFLEGSDVDDTGCP